MENQNNNNPSQQAPYYTQGGSQPIQKKSNNTKIIVCSLVGVFFLLLLCVAGCAGSIYLISNSDSAKEPNLVNESGDVIDADTEDFYIGDYVKADDLIVRVIGVEEDYESSNTYYQPASGNHFIAVEIMVHNVDKYTSHTLSEGDFSVRDSEGYNYYTKYINDQSYKSLARNTLTIDEDEKTKGYIFFEVPEDNEGLSLIYDSWSIRQIKINLEEK